MTRRFKPITNRTLRFSLSKKVVCGILISLCFIVQIFFTIETSANGAQIANLEEEQERLSKENRELEEKLVTSTSLSDLEKRAEDLGFSNDARFYYLKKGEAFAKLP